MYEQNIAHLVHRKIFGPQDLAKSLEKIREGRTVVFTNGCYDILHPGHVDLLARCREHGDTLILGLNTDESVRRLGKGADRPVNPLAYRAYVAAHLAHVTYVTWFDEDTPQELISMLKPDVLIKGGDWPVDQIVGREVVQERGGKVLSLPLLPGYSTTDVINRIRTTAP